MLIFHYVNINICDNNLILYLSYSVNKETSEKKDASKFIKIFKPFNRFKSFVNKVKTIFYIDYKLLIFTESKTKCIVV